MGGIPAKVSPPTSRYSRKKSIHVWTHLPFSPCGGGGLGGRHCVGGCWLFAADRPCPFAFSGLESVCGGASRPSSPSADAGALMPAGAADAVRTAGNLQDAAGKGIRSRGRHQRASAGVQRQGTRRRPPGCPGAGCNTRFAPDAHKILCGFDQRLHQRRRHGSGDAVRLHPADGDAPNANAAAGQALVFHPPLTRQ